MVYTDMMQEVKPKIDLLSVLILMAIFVGGVTFAFNSRQNQDRKALQRISEITSVGEIARLSLSNLSNWETSSIDREELENRGFYLASRYSKQLQDLAIVNDQPYKLLLGPSQLYSNNVEQPSAWLCPRANSPEWRCLKFKPANSGSKN